MKGVWSHDCHLSLPSVMGSACHHQWYLFSVPSGIPCIIHMCVQKKKKKKFQNQLSFSNTRSSNLPPFLPSIFPSVFHFSLSSSCFFLPPLPLLQPVTCKHPGTTQLRPCPCLYRAYLLQRRYETSKHMNKQAKYYEGKNPR